MKQILFWLVVSFTCVADAEQDQKFVISYVEQPHIQKYIDLVKQSYADIGIQTEFAQIPIGRRAVELNKGTFDADVSAQQWFIQDNPNILQVNPPLAELVVYLSCIDDLVCHEDVIHDESKRIFIDSGMVLLLNETINYRPHNRVYLLENVTTTLEMLEKRRIQYLVWSADSSQSIPASFTHSFRSIQISSANIHHHIHI